MVDAGTVRAFLEDSHVELAGRAGAWAAETLQDRPEPAGDEEARREARALVKELAGWYAPIASRDLRGCAIVREALAAASPLADAVFALQALGTFPILLGGSKEQRARWADPALSGDSMAAFAMTEPDAGSDVGALATTAVRDGDGYVVDGTKTLISNAGIADFYTLFAKTESSDGKARVSAFVVPADAKGLRFTGAQVLSAAHPLGEIELSGCRVGADHLLGREGKGLSLGLGTLDGLRATVAAAACGMAARALEEALSWAGSRRQFGKLLHEHQLVAEKLARMATDLTAARLLTYRALWEKDRGAERVSLESGMAKAFATEAAQRIVDDAVQILGGRGMLRENPVERLYRSVRALRIYEGTTEIQHLIIADHLVREHGEKPVAT